MGEVTLQLGKRYVLQFFYFMVTYILSSKKPSLLQYLCRFRTPTQKTQSEFSKEYTKFRTRDEFLQVT